METSTMLAQLIMILFAIIILLIVVSIPILLKKNIGNNNSPNDLENRVARLEEEMKRLKNQRG